MCLKTRRADRIAQVAPQDVWGEPQCWPIQKIAKAGDLLARDG